MPWRALPVEWDHDALNYVSRLAPALRADLFSAIDRYADHGIAGDVSTWVTPRRIDGIIRAEGHEILFYIVSVGGKPTLTIAEVSKV